MMHRSGVRVAALLLVISAATSCHDATTAPAPLDETAAGHWRTWLLASGSELRPAAPAAEGSAAATAELAVVVARQQRRTATDAAAIARWSASATAPWDSVALQTLDFFFPLLPEVRLATPVRAARTMAVLHTAVHDAVVASWDAKYLYRRRTPAASDSRIVALTDDHGIPSYPSEHAAVAAAASAVLAALFPALDTAALHAMEREAGDSRIVAGVAYPSDVAAGAAIGRAVAARAIARAAADGSSQPWSGTAPLGEGLWLPTTNKFVSVPFDAGAGGWRTWVLLTGDVHRPAPPPAVGSAIFQHDLNELRTLSAGRSAEQTNVARYWATDAPSVIWEKYMLQEIASRKLGTVSAARAQALASVAMYDAFVACWDAKFTYWLARPITMDASLRPVFPTPPFPSYPSGHSTISSAAAEVFAELFPDAATKYRDRATEASVSRVYAGVHYRFDVEAGDSLGVRVGHAVVLRARQDGAAP